MDSADSYCTLRQAWQNRHNFADIFTATLDQLSTEPCNICGDIGAAAASCLVLGPAGGQYELDFIERYLPNINAVHTVEQDERSSAEFQRSLKSRLPRVGGVAYCRPMQSWEGVAAPVDVAIAFRSLYLLRQPQRQALFRLLFDKYLSPGGYIVLMESSQLENPRHSVHLVAKLNPDYASETYEDIRQNLLDAGFHLMWEREMRSHRDFSNPDEKLLQLYQYILHNTVSTLQVADAINELYPDGISDYIQQFGIFRKLPVTDIVQ